MMEGSKMASCFIFLILLFLLLFVEGRIEASMDESDEKSKQIEMKDFIETTSITQDPIIKMVTKMGDNIQNSQDDDQFLKKKKKKKNNGHSSSSSHMNHINPLLIVFFTINDLKVGKKLPIYFPKREPSKSPPFLPKEKANQIPFSFKQLPQILSYFSFPSNSHQAQAIKETLQQCELKPIKGETKFCATSMESMVDFVRTSLIIPTKTSSLLSSFKLLKTSHLTKSNVHFQNYTIFDTPMEIAAPKLVACHTMPYPYAIYYCHYQEGDNNVLKIDLEGENGDRVEALAICHMDTSQWSPTHPSFQVLKLQPGDMPICHFFPADDFVWIPIQEA